MNLFQRIASIIGISQKTANSGKTQILRKNSKKGLYYKLKLQNPYRVTMGIEQLENAIIQAESPTFPSRLALYAIYREVMRDTEVFTATRNIENMVIASDFDIVKEGKNDEELKKLLRRPWLSRYIKHWVEHIWWGHSLIEFCPMVESMSDMLEKEFDKIKLIPREHVHPWSGQVVMTPSARKGISYRDTTWKKQLVEIGEADDLGLLLIAAREAIYKRYSRTDWSRASEKFGMPITVAKTASRDEKELDEKERMLANIGSSGYAILDDDDDINLVEPSKTDAYKIYLEALKYSDSVIAKVILGQTGTTDEKSFVGSAEVHERVLNIYILSLLMRLQDHINYVLIPFLISNNYPLQGTMFEFQDIAKLKKSAEKATTPTETEKKKLTLSDFYKLCKCSLSKQKQVLTIANIEKLIASAVKRIYDKKLKSGQLDKKLFMSNVEELVKAVEEGIGKKYASIEFRDKDFDLMVQLKRNIYVFAAFKNYANINDMVAALEDNGNVVDFRTFKQRASMIAQSYNVDYLQTEYNTAIAQAQQGAKWTDILKAKDSLPLLQYDAVNDDRTRPEHAKLNGVTLPVEHEFWQEFYPPNGFNCRCIVRQLADGNIKQPPKQISTQDIPKAFRNNAGASGRLYSNEHPYFENVSDKDSANILEAMRTFILEDSPNFDKSLRAVKRKNNTPSNLSMIEKASIYHYTTPAYQNINLRLRVERMSDEAWAHSEQLSLALSKLPNFKGDSYRFIQNAEQLIAQLNRNFVDKTPYIEKGFASSSRNPSFMAVLAQQTNGQRNRAIIRIQGKTGKDISSMSKKQRQEEILFDKSSSFQVIGFSQREDGIYLIDLKQ